MLTFLLFLTFIALFAAGCLVTWLNVTDAIWARQDRLSQQEAKKLRKTLGYDQ